MPFFELASIQSAGSPLSSPMGLSSKIVPSFTENCRPQSRHFQMRRVLRKPGSLASQAGQGPPIGPRGAARKGGVVILSARERHAPGQGGGAQRGLVSDRKQLHRAAG